MQAEALVQVDALMDVIIAALAATFVAIDQAKGCSVVPCRDNSLVLCDDGTIAPLHAVRTARGKLGKSHKVGVEAGANQLRVFEIKLG